ncbi:unnamed protein product [Rodentolepis nana]|uniref:PINc domain-containing protein n=1 Tax=Rodentolepis nana TaxID=102285 RepID=A0A0R3TQ09_RODNA|nr:unnamed protein product [Rodentolepis nana]
MSLNTGTKSVHLIVDSAAFIERAKLETYGEHLHTTQSVLDELRDKRTRSFINSLPYPLKIDIPMPESIKWVKELSLKTGDYHVLSKTDIDVIAVTYQLYKEVNGNEPDIRDVKRPTFSDKLFRFKKPPEPENQSKSKTPLKPDNDFNEKEIMEKIKNDLGEADPNTPNSNSDVGITIDEDDLLSDDEEANKSIDCNSDGSAENESEVDDSDWITADNFDEKLLVGLGFGGLRLDDEVENCSDGSPVPVACLTKDFAMQNVMMNAGIPLLSLSGKIIKRARTHVLWCGSCYAHTTKQDSYFCRMCGYPSLRRIPVTLHEDGQLEFHFSRKFVKNLRGTKHPVPRPKGGKHADEPIYRADQRLPDRRAPKPKNPNVLPMGATNGLLYNDDDSDDDIGGFLIDSNVEATGDLATVVFPAHDVSSKAATHGLRADGQIVPAPWERKGMEHGLKPTRFKANRPGRRRTGGKRNKLTK